MESLRNKKFKIHKGGGEPLERANPNYYKEFDIQKHICQDSRDLEILFVKIDFICLDEDKFSRQKKIFTEINNYKKQRFENLGDWEQ